MQFCFKWEITYISSKVVEIGHTGKACLDFVIDDSKLSRERNFSDDVFGGLELILKLSATIKQAVYEERKGKSELQQRIEFGFLILCGFCGMLK